MRASKRRARYRDLYITCDGARLDIKVEKSAITCKILKSNNVNVQDRNIKGSKYERQFFFLRPCRNNLCP